jgi:hypothetical protein
MEEELDEILEPREEEVELYDEDSYDQLLDELYGPFEIGYIKFYASRILQELDPIAYSCGLSDIQEYSTKYYCPICNNEYEDYESAKWCCQVEPEELEED